MTTSFLYIDPGTGSMLLSLIIGLATAAVFGIRALAVKLLFIFSGGKTNKIQQTKIPYLIFSDHKRYWNVFKPICDEFEKRKINLVYYTLSPDDPVLNEKYEFVRGEFIGEGNKGIARMNMVNAGIVIATTPQLDVIQWKRSKTVDCYVHIPHTVDDLAGYRMFGLDYYDAVLTTGVNQQVFIKKVEDARQNIKKKELFSVGSLTLDNLKKKYDTTERVRNEKKVVLLAPSWGKSGILSRYGEKLLSALTKTDFEIIVRPHPQTIVSEQDILKPLQEKFSNIEWNSDNDNFNVLNKADILITDFSGIIFDYSLVFDKPIIYADTSFDTLPYDADWFDEKIWALRAVENLGVQLKESDFDKIEDVVNEALNSENLQAARNQIRNECWEKIGASAMNATNWLVEKHKQLTEGSK